MKNGRIDGLSILAKRFPDLPPQVRYVADPDETTLTAIRRGLIFFMAFWSGTSFRSLRHLIDALKERSPDLSEFDVVIIDVDGAESLYRLVAESPFRGVLHGNGEIAWALDGKIVEFSHGVSEGADAVRQALDRTLWAR